MLVHACPLCSLVCVLMVFLCFVYLSCGLSLTFVLVVVLVWVCLVVAVTSVFLFVAVVVVDCGDSLLFLSFI